MLLRSSVRVFLRCLWRPTAVLVSAPAICLVCCYIGCVIELFKNCDKNVTQNFALLQHTCYSYLCH